VSVNVSSLQVGRRDLPDVVHSALSASGLDPHCLVLELTEDRLLSRPDGPELLARLRDRGVRLAIDDFGTGYAGLGYLQRFPTLEVIKLDRSFVADLGRSPVSEHIVRSVVELARGCGLRLIVEGVETEQQAADLRELGVTHAQGYLFGRPAPLNEISAQRP
jgi:EAL domain-containing protein (putative c-di-GMP-specific phosphodiesterase class I)